MKKSNLSVALSNAMQRPDKPQDYYKLRNQAGRNVVEISGYVGWWDDEAIWLKNYLRQHEGEDIEFNISSEGGDVFTGQSMYNVIKAHKGKTTCHVEKAFSIASHIAMACDERKIVKGGQMMAHAVSGVCGGTDKDHESYANLIRNAKDAIADSYVDVTGHDKDYWLEIMATDAGKYFNAQECVEIGLADEIIEPSAMTNHADEPEQEEQEEQDEPNGDETPPAPTEENPQGDKSSTGNEPPEQYSPQEDEIVNKELERQKSIRNLFNSLQSKLGLPFSLLNSALDDETVDITKASQMFADHTGEEEPKERNPVNFGASHHANYSDAQDMAINVLLNRAGVEDIKSDFKSMQGASLVNVARSFQGMQAHGFGDNLFNAAIEHEGISTAFGVALDKVVKSEETNSASKSLALQFCKEVRKNKIDRYEVHNWNEIDGFGTRAGGKETGEFPELQMGGGKKREGEIVERGSKILVTRKAFVNDEWDRVSGLAQEHTKSAYRAADALFIQRLMALAAEGIIIDSDPRALMQKLSLALRQAVTSNGDDLGYKGGRLLATPTYTDMFKPICKTPTIEVDVINPAFGAFLEFFDVNKLDKLTVGFADGEMPMELAVLTGKERPHLVKNNRIDQANGMGWTLIWDFDIQVSNPKAITLGAPAALEVVANEETGLLSLKLAEAPKA